MVPRPQSSAAGALSLLDEPNPEFKQYALAALNPLVPQFWSEISEHITTIESIYENNDLSPKVRELAALLASKVFYYLAEYDEALSFALGAGSAFRNEANNALSAEYIETIISRAVDRYVEARTGAGNKDERLDAIMETIFSRCMEEGNLKQAIGVALESKRLDMIAHIYARTKDTELLSYAMEAVMDSGFSLAYRNQVLNFLLPLFPTLTAKSPHIHAVTRLLVALSDSLHAIKLLARLVPDELLVAYQLAFDLAEGGSQEFTRNVSDGLPKDDVNSESWDVIRRILSGEESIKLYLEFLKRNNKTDMAILKNTKDSLEPRSSIYHTALSLCNAFMHSGTASDQFLRENLEWLVKASNWSKFSATAALGVIHKGNLDNGMELLSPYLPTEGNGQTSGSGSQYAEGGALYALGLVNAGHGSGRPVETYLIEKLKAASLEPVQHGAALGLGVAGMGSGNVEAYEALKEKLYLEQAVTGEAAGLAMGLIMMGRATPEVKDEMWVYAQETRHEKIIRGLSLGLAFLFYGRQEQADSTIREMLNHKDPLIRYGGVYTLALAYAGTADNNSVRKLLHIAVSDTSDDVRRAAVTSLAFLLFKNPSQVPRMVQLLSESYNPHVRCGATLALGIACAGTGFQDAVDILEPMTKDPVDFVRQGALIALGMVLVQQSEASSPSLSATRALYRKIISDKHEDPMARFGAVLGEGLMDAGGRNVTISLQSMLGSHNTSSIVGMALFCQFWYWYPLAHCACLAFEPTAMIGLTKNLKPAKFEFVSNARPSLFAYPSPIKPPTKETVEKVATAVLSTTAKAKAREKTKEKEKKDAMDTDDKPEEKDDKKESMVVEETGPKSGDISPIAGSMSNLTEVVIVPEGEVKEKVEKATPRKREPSSTIQPNFSRVTPAQIAYISFPGEGRYQPVRSVTASSGKTGKNGKNSVQVARALSTSRYAGGGGILLLVDSKPEEEEELIEWKEEAAPAPTVEANAPAAMVVDATVPEAAPPEPFEYPFDRDT